MPFTNPSILFYLWLFTTAGFAYAQADISKFAAHKAPAFAQKTPASTAIFPKRGLVAVTSGVTSCCSAVVVDIDAKTLTVRSGQRFFTDDPLAIQKTIVLAPTELAALVVKANSLWITTRTSWGERCGDIPCRPSLDYISEIWLVDGDTLRYDSSLNPVDPNGEFYQLRELLTKTAYPDR